MIDPLATRAMLAGLIAPVLPLATITQHAPPAAFEGQNRKPFGWVRAPRHGTAHRESGSRGSPRDVPNLYVLFYLEQALVPGGPGNDALEDRVYAAYAAVANRLVTLDGDDCGEETSVLTTVSVTMLFDFEEGAFINVLAKTWIGARIHIVLEERYE